MEERKVTNARIVGNRIGANKLMITFNDKHGEHCYYTESIYDRCGLLQTIDYDDLDDMIGMTENELKELIEPYAKRQSRLEDY